VALDFTTYITTMANMLSISPETVLYPDNAELVEAMISYSEMRIYRELDFLRTVEEATTGDLTPGTRSVALPGNILIVNSATLITPASTAPDAGSRNPMQRVSMEFINFIWPSAATTGIPSHYAMLDEDTVILAPTPAAAYRACFLGIVRPAPLTALNTTTYLTEFVPDLFIAASAIWGFGGINRNFGAASDDPASAQSWEQTYQNLRAGVDVENLRSKAWGAGFQPFSPAPMAKESRT
jgi:hypothetical protein